MFMDPKYWEENNPILFESDLEAQATEDITRIMLEQTYFNHQLLGKTIERVEVVNDVFTKHVIEITLHFSDSSRVTIRRDKEQGMEVTVS
jgi:hypothetical protein